MSKVLLVPTPHQAPMPPALIGWRPGAFTRFAVVSIVGALDAGGLLAIAYMSMQIGRGGGL